MTDRGDFGDFGGGPGADILRPGRHFGQPWGGTKGVFVSPPRLQPGGGLIGEHISVSGSCQIGAGNESSLCPVFANQNSRHRLGTNGGKAKTDKPHPRGPWETGKTTNAETERKQILAEKEKKNKNGKKKSTPPPPRGNKRRGFSGPAFVLGLQRPSTPRP